MINLDTRLLKKLNESELWFLMHIVTRVNEDHSCFPSNKTIMKDTGWGPDKLQSVKRHLQEKGLLEIIPATNERGRQTSNTYHIRTRMISFFVEVDKLGRIPEKPTPRPLRKATPTEGAVLPPPIEVLSIEEVLSKGSIKASPPSLEERKLAFGKSLEPFQAEYSKEMLLEFYRYWIESNDDGKKMKFEIERSRGGTFSISGRLRTWKKNQEKFAPKKKFESNPVPSIVSNPESYRPA